MKKITFLSISMLAFIATATANENHIINKLHESRKSSKKLIEQNTCTQTHSYHVTCPNGGTVHVATHAIHYNCNTGQVVGDEIAYTGKRCGSEPVTELAP